ncbi:hypothetical protein GS449_14340 [Rhodococcus hoagii]|nr:hypothetical protein [Prescottella equi]
MSDTTPELGAITRTSGVAGQFSYRVPVTYPAKAPAQSSSSAASTADRSP